MKSFQFKSLLLLTILFTSMSSWVQGLKAFKLKNGLSIHIYIWEDNTDRPRIPQFSVETRECVREIQHVSGQPGKRAKQLHPLQGIRRASLFARCHRTARTPEESTPEQAHQILRQLV